MIELEGMIRRQSATVIAFVITTRTSSEKNCCRSISSMAPIRNVDAENGNFSCDIFVCRENTARITSAYSRLKLGTRSPFSTSPGSS